MLGMIGTPRPTRVDKRIVKPLLDIVDHSLLVVTHGIGKNTDARSCPNDFILMVATDCRGNIHLQQVNHALLVFVGYRNLGNGLNFAPTAEAKAADWTQPLNLQMPSTQRPPAHSTDSTAQLMESRSAFRTCERYDIHPAKLPNGCPANTEISCETRRS